MKDKILKQHTLYSVVLLVTNMMVIPTALLKEKKKNHVELLHHANETLAGTGLMATLTCTYNNKMVSFLNME